MNNDLKCPYCGHEQDVCHDDGEGYDEGMRHEMGCLDCGKDFVFLTTISITYEPMKAECLNDEDHKLAPTTTYPHYYVKLACSDCGYKRDFTADEARDFFVGAID